jgi:hypothetical protein
MKHDAALVPDPPRLLGGGTAPERQLLQSARWDAAPAGARERMARALGPVLVDTPTLPGTLEPTRGEWLRAAFTPRAALGLVGAGIGAYLLASLLSRPADVSDAAASVAAREPAAVASGLQLAPAPDDQPLSSGPARLAPRPQFTEGAPVLFPSAPQRQHRAPSAKLETGAAEATRPQRRTALDEQPAAASTGTLLEEVRLLDAVRSKLREGQVEDASRGLGQYDRRFPRGELRREKSVLGLDLLLARGQAGPARARAKELLVQPGMQRYAAHLRAIAESGSAGGRSGSGSDISEAHIRVRR